MSNYQVKLNTNAKLSLRIENLERENQVLRDRMAVMHHEPKQEPQADCPPCDMASLKKRRKYLEDRSERDVKLNERLHHNKNVIDGFKCEGKSKLLCLLQDLQKWKIKLAEAELAQVMQQIWACKTRNFEDHVGNAIDCINVEIKKCPDSVDYFVADTINDVMKDC